MVDAKDITGAAGEIAEQVRDKVGEVAGEVIGKAVPLAGQAAATATELVGKAGAAAAQGVDAVAGTINTVTGGRVADHVETVSTAIKDVLDPKKD